MTPDELREIELWARAWAQAGSATARLVLRLLAAHRVQEAALRVQSEAAAKKEGRAA